MQPIDHLNCLMSIKGIAFINITLPKKKSPGVDVFYEEVYHAFKKNWTGILYNFFQKIKECPIDFMILVLSW